MLTSPFGDVRKENMKEIIILAILVIVTFYATFAESAIRKVCYNVVDNSTNYENCKFGGKKWYLNISKNLNP